MNLDDAMMEKMAEFMQKRGLVFSPAEGASSNADAVLKGMETRGKQSGGPIKHGQHQLPLPIQETVSEDTIYQRAIPSKRDSSSSEEGLNLSDETQLMETNGFFVADGAARGSEG